MAQLERDIIAERVKAGLRKAVENGKKLGRPRIKVSENQLLMLSEKGLSIRQIARQVNLSVTTVARRLKGVSKTL